MTVAISVTRKSCPSGIRKYLISHVTEARGNVYQRNSVCECVFVYVCLREKETERDRERGGWLASGVGGCTGRYNALN